MNVLKIKYYLLNVSFMMFLFLFVGGFVIFFLYLCGIIGLNPKIGYTYTSKTNPFDITKSTNTVLDIKEHYVLYKDQFNHTNSQSINDFRWNFPRKVILYSLEK